MKTFDPSKLFIIAVQHALALEGGYVNDEVDRGGKTHYGISDAADGKKDGLIDIDGDGTGDVAAEALTRQQAIEKYWRDYWEPIHCDDLPYDYALFLFDAAIQHGTKTAALMLQSHLSVTCDGDIGPITCQAAKRYNNPESLALLFARRAEHYALIVRSDSTQARFLKGWFNRLFKLQHFIFSLNPIGNERWTL